MRQAIGTMATVMTLGLMCGTALAGPFSPSLQLQAQESWQTSATETVKGKKVTVITDHTASSGVIIATPHSGRVEYQTSANMSFGTFSSLSAIGLGFPLVGTAQDDEIDLSGQLSQGKIANLVAGSVVLNLLLTETGLPTGLGTLPFEAEIGGTLGKGMVLSDRTYVDPGDHPFGETTPLTNMGFPTMGAFAWSGTVDQSEHGEFSMTELVTIEIPSSAAASGTSFDAALSTTAVPEPGTAMMLGLSLGMIGLVIGSRKSKRIECL